MQHLNSSRNSWPCLCEITNLENCTQVDMDFILKECFEYRVFGYFSFNSTCESKGVFIEVKGLAFLDLVLHVKLTLTKFFYQLLKRHHSIRNTSGKTESS